jgi:hypothetical protein
VHSWCTLAQRVQGRLHFLLVAKLKRDRAPSIDIAVIYAGLGDSDAAFEWLDKAYEQRSELLAELKVDSRWSALRSDPRFHQLTSRMGL